VRDPRDDRPADAQPQAAERRAAPAQAVIKQWILPTGNDFIADPGRRFERPTENWGGDVAYVQPDFDDSSWRRVNLPHDWALKALAHDRTVGEWGSCQ
jgi:beta-galactosidase